jgi:trimethylamine---corrinoid protein Co-methyltransferase
MKRNFHAGKQLSGGLGLNIFSKDEMDEIHLATLEVLQHTGLFVEDDEALEIFHGGGAEVHKATRTVKIPPHLVEDAIRWAPAKLVLAGRKPQRDMVIESNRVGFTNFGEGIQLVDPYSGQLRVPGKADLCAAGRLVDYLDDVDVMEKAMGCNDVPQEVAAIHNAHAMLTNTTKHCFTGPHDGFGVRAILEMAAAIAGGPEQLRQRPLISFITCPVSPLHLVQDLCEIVITAARSGAVCNILSMAMAGGSSPATLAGTLVTHNAEVLGGIVLSQLTCKGAKVIYGSSTTAMDLRNANATVGTPECALISAAVARLARYYGLPSFVAGG